MSNTAPQYHRLREGHTLPTSVSPRVGFRTRSAGGSSAPSQWCFPQCRPPLRRVLGKIERQRQGLQTSPDLVADEMPQTETKGSSKKVRALRDRRDSCATRLVQTLRPPLRETAPPQSS